MKNIIDNGFVKDEVVSALKENSFRLGWTGCFATTTIVIVGNYKEYSYLVYFILFLQYILAAMMDILSSRFNFHLNIKNDDWLKYTLSIRILFYALMSSLVTIYFITNGFGGYGSLLAMAILAGGVESIGFHSYLRPKFCFLLMWVFTTAPLINFISQVTGKDAIVYSFFALYIIVQLPKIKMRYRFFLEKVAFKYELFVEKNNLNSIIEMLPTGLIWFDNSFKIIALNDFVLSHSNKKRDEIIGSDFNVLKNSFYSPIMLKNFQESEEKEISTIVSIKLNSGEINRFRVNYKKLDNNRGIILVATNIESEFRSIDEHTHIIRRFNLLSSASHMSTWMLDISSSEYYYYDNIDIIGMKLNKADTIEEFQKRIDHNILQNYLFEFETIVHGDKDFANIEIRYDHPKKGWIWLKIFFMIYERDINNRPTSLIGFHQDISEQKLNEAMIMQSSKLASLGVMAAGIAHEINNPLAIINSKTFLLKKHIDKEDIDKAGIKSYLETIEKTVQRIVKIIKGLKHISREGSTDPFEMTSLKDILSETISFAETRYRSSDVILTIEPYNDDLKIYCRPVQISQVILNLINNSFDAVVMNQEKWIKIKIEEFEKHIEIRVIDSGKGIPKDIQAKLLTPFYTTKEVGKGTGLGLSISSGIIRDHFGEFAIDNDCPNTCFLIKLPKPQPIVDKN